MEQKNRDDYQADISRSGSAEKFNQPIDLAAKIFNAERALCDAQEEVEQALHDAGILRPQGWEDWWFDHYDTSIEIKGVPEGFVLTDEHLMSLHDMGFSRIWTHGPDGEKYYGTLSRTPSNGERTSGPSDSADCLKSDTSVKDSEA